MNKKQFRTSEVEKLLGVSRAAIRYYLDRGFLEVEKDKESGYRIYSMDDVMDLLEIFYGRNALDLSFKDMCEWFQDEGITEVLHRQKKMLADRIEQDKKRLVSISICEKIAQRIELYLNKINVVTFAPMYCLPQEYAFNSNSLIFNYCILSAEFSRHENNLSFNNFCSIIHKEDYIMIDKNDIESKAQQINSDQFVYTVVKSDKEMSCPTLLEPVIRWAEEHEVLLKDPFYISYLYKIIGKKENNYYYEIYLPVVNEKDNKLR